jgi:hypothetical protein
MAQICFRYNLLQSQDTHFVFSILLRMIEKTNRQKRRNIYTVLSSHSNENKEKEETNERNRDISNQCFSCD